MQETHTHLFPDSGNPEWAAWDRGSQRGHLTQSKRIREGILGEKTSAITQVKREKRVKAARKEIWAHYWNRGVSEWPALL